MLANPSRTYGSVDSIIRTNDLTHFNPSSVFIYMHGARWDSSPIECAGHMMHLNNNEYEYIW